MGPPRRQPPPATTTTMPYTSSSTSLAPPDRVIPSGSQAPPSLGMTPASRYNYNLKVLRRRDPSILSIFDQFSHVCVYHHDGQKWDKHGYEGSMFLFERDSYPPYGFYIMNRVGMDDYIQPLYPEDDVVHSGKFLIIRSYPDFLSNRLTSIRSAHPGQQFDKFSDVYSIPNIDQIDSKAKGRSSIIGLWMHADDSRESLIEVMRKLHTYIKKNEAYPEEYHYGPGRPPPPHRLRAIPKKTAGNTSDSQGQSENEQSYYSDVPSSSNGGLSAIDKLFSKALVTTQSAAPTPAPTGLSLLNDIFASASSPKPTSANPTSTIFAPQPALGASGPQVLNPQVLTTILTGSAPSRASSVISHPSSREGDNEADVESDSPSTVLDEDSDYQQQKQPVFQTGGSIARLAGADLLSAFGFGAPRPGQKINGDVTPRPPLNGTHRTPAPLESTLSVSTVRGSTTTNAPAPSFPVPEPAQKPRANRSLVPFESDSELWPYNQKQAEDSSVTDDGEDIVELNFEDTSVLSDPDAFKKVLKERKSAVSLRSSSALNGSANRPVVANGTSPAASIEKGRVRTKRKSKKERDAKERDDIEKGWDFPPPSPAASRGLGMETVFGHNANGSSASRSPSPVVSIREKASSPTAASEMKTPTMTAKMMLFSNVPPVPTVPAKAKAKAVNGHSKTNGHAVTGPFDPEVVRDSIITAIAAQPKPIPSMDKNEFMREVVLLIHTDKAFVERLYQDYVARLA